MSAVLRTLATAHSVPKAALIASRRQAGGATR